MLPKYKVIDRLLVTSDNSALHVGLYKVDEQTLRVLHKVILLIRRENIEELNKMIDHSKQFMDQGKYITLSKNCNRLKEKIINSIDNMEDDQEVNINKFQAIVSTLSITVKYFGALGRNIYRFASMLNQIRKKGYDHYTQMKKFQSEIQKYLIDSLETELASIEDSLASYQTRLAKTKTIINYNKERSQMSYREILDKERK